MIPRSSSTTQITQRTPSARRTSRARLLVVPLFALLFASCIAADREPGVLLATDPPGARVVVEGEDSGMVTPCHIDLPRDPQRVDLELLGYQTATRYFSPDTNYNAVLWDEMVVSTDTWRFPLWLEWKRFLFPIWRTNHMSPARVFVRMRISGEG